MTMVAALIGNDGIVCIGDGRVRDEHGNIIPDELKLFELSQACVALPDGMVFEGISEVFGILRDIFTESRVEEASDIASLAAEFFEEGESQNGRPTNPYGMIIAGYDHDKPVLWRIESKDWKPRRVPPYDIGGLSMEASQIFSREYDLTSKDIKKLNILALKAMKFTIRRYSSDVGGDIALWNVKPNERIRKFEKSVIRKLMDKISE